MEAILHAIGLCPDSIGHLDIMDIVVCYYGELQSIMNLIKIRIGS
jgi:hypothetical protein